MLYYFTATNLNIVEIHALFLFFLADLKITTAQPTETSTARPESSITTTTGEPTTSIIPSLTTYLGTTSQNTFAITSNKSLTTMLQHSAVAKKSQLSSEHPEAGFLVSR